MRLLPALLALLAFAGCTTEADESRLVPVTADQLQEEVRALGADAVVVNVWATWCGPCRAEFPEFVRYAKDAQGEGVEVRFLSVDEPELRPRVEAFLAEYGAEGRSYLSAEGSEIVAMLAAPSRWGYGIPVTLIYGPEGELRAFWEGTMTYDILRTMVERVRSEAAAG